MRLIDADALMADLEKWLRQIDPTHPSEDNAIPPMEDIIAGYGHIRIGRVKE